MSVGYIKNSKNDKIVINQIIVKPANRNILDIGKWSDALKSADRGRRKDLLDLYENILTDGVLGDAVDKRIRAVTGSDLTFQMADGTESEEMTAFIDTEEFEYLLEEIIKAVFWKFSVIEPVFDEAGMHVYSVPRKHIRLETKSIAINETDVDGQISYADLDVIEVVSRSHQHGLLLRACPYAILKRGGIGDWAQMVEIFGMPKRIGKYSMYDAEGRKALQEAFNSQGGAATLIVPKETEIETSDQSGNGGGSLYKDFKDAMDEQILITVLSQTMTTKNGSSKSQSETHKEVEEEVNKQDLRFVQRILNHRFLPILEKRGYPVKGGSFVFPKSLDKITVAEIVSLSKVLPIPQYYVQERFGIPAAEKDDAVIGSSSPDTDTDTDVEKPENKNKKADPEEKTKKKLSDFFADAPTKERGIIRNFIKKLTGSTKVIKLADDDPYSIDMDSLLQQAIDELYNNAKDEKKQPVVSKPLFSITNAALQQGIDKAFDEPEFGKKNAEFINEFKRNAAVFSAFKNHQQTKEIAALIIDEEGNMRSFRKFKKLALEISKDYNENWLRTEFNTAVKAARSAVNYRKMLETKDLYPNLEYVRTTAVHPRELHLDWVGTVLPIDHKWWDTHYPPSDWNCSCSVKQTDKDVTDVPEPGGEKPTFKNNPGKSAEFVKIDKTTYYEETKKSDRKVVIDIAEDLFKEYLDSIPDEEEEK